MHYKCKYNLHSQTPEEISSFEVISNDCMKCRFPVVQVDGVTIAILPCRRDGEHLGLLLHPGPKDPIQGLSRQVYYVSWLFSKPTGSDYWSTRLASLGNDMHNLRFRGKPVNPSWQDMYIAARPPTTGRRDGAHLLQRFLLDVSPTAFRVPRALMQSLGALGFFPTTWTKPSNSASRDVMLVRWQNTALLEAFLILLGTCQKGSIGEHPCHWAWAIHRHSATWTQPLLKHVHDCATDHTEDWPNSTREFGDTERTIRLVFAPCKHAPESTLVLRLELSGSRYEEIQQKANIYLRPQVTPPGFIAPPKRSALGRQFSFCPYVLHD